MVRELGAPLAQGWLYGAPTDAPVPGAQYRFHREAGRGGVLEDVRTPFDVLGGRTISRASAEVIHSLSHEIFTTGMHLEEPSLVLVLVPHPNLLNEMTRHVLSQLASRRVVVGALGRGLSGEPIPGVRGSWEYDPSLDGEWARIAVSPSTAVAVLARQIPGSASRFAFGVTHDRQRVLSAARCLLRRLGPRVEAAQGSSSLMRT